MRNIPVENREFAYSPKALRNLSLTENFNGCGLLTEGHGVFLNNIKCGFWLSVF
jgi:hypothetical protein